MGVFADKAPAEQARLGAAIRCLLALVAVLLQSPLHAAGVLSVSPQGEALDVRQVVVRFDADMVPLGQDGGAEPATVQCLPQAPPGRARWLGPRTWAFEFAQDVRGGTRCNVVFKSPLKTLSTEPLAQPPAFSFVAGPSGFFASYPPEGVEVQPDQVFLLRHHDPQPTASPQQLAASFICEQRDDDKVQPQPARLATGEEASAAQRMAPSGAYALALRCAQPLPEGTQLRLRQTLPDSRPGKVFNYTVRRPFTARLECTVIEYPKGRTGCDPRQPLILNFSSPVSRAQAQAIRLVDAAGSELAFEVVGSWRGNDETTQLRLPPPKESFGEGSRYLLRLASGLSDLLGRPLSNAEEFLARPVDFARLPPYLGAANTPAVMAWQAGEANAVAAFAVRRLEKSVPLRHWRLGGEMGSGMEVLAIELLQSQQSGKWPADELIGRLGAPQTTTLATQGGAMEFVAAPIAAPGLHVVRADSAAFAEYMNARSEVPGAAADTPARQRYALVQATNLNIGASLSEVGASVIWVTALDTARPVAGAEVAIYSCRRELLWRGRTNDQGLAEPGENLRGKLACNLSTNDPRHTSGSSWVVARAGNDMALMQNSPGWRQATAAWGAQSLRAHTVLDRTLFRAGETVSMQHFVRLLESRGFTLPSATTLDVEIHYGWQAKVYSASVPLDADGSATSSWAIPLDAKLGNYVIKLSQSGVQLAFSNFQVEEFRTPVFSTQLHAQALWRHGTQQALVDAHVRYFAGGAAAGLPMSVQQGWLRRVQSPRAGYTFYEELDTTKRLVPPTLPPRSATLDAQGGAQILLNIPPLQRPMLLQTELKFQDPNGETQTTGASTMLWPDRLKLGLRVRGKDRDRPQAIEGIALDDRDQPVAAEPVTLRVKPVKLQWQGSGYVYTDLGPETQICSMLTGEFGQWSCDWQLPEVPEDQQVAEYWQFSAHADSLRRSHAPVRTDMVEARWSLGWRKAEARTALNIENGPSFQSDETAIVLARPERLPATLLLTTEREGVLAASVHPLTTMTQRIEVPLTAQHAPNVYLVARYVYPSQDAPLDAPLASTQRADVLVRPDAWKLSVRIRPANDAVRPRTQVPVEVSVRDAAGRPVPSARVTLAVVDKALLALKRNDTWGLTDAMFAERNNSVVTTALDANLLRRIELGPQPQHRPEDEGQRGRWGAAAPMVAASKMVSPEERDVLAPRADRSSLLLWHTDLRTDSAGLANATVPLNDALTQFQVVAFASAGPDQFGEGNTILTSTQPLQIFSGLPEVLRADDAIVQKLSLRNSSTSPMAVVLKADAHVVAHTDWADAYPLTTTSALTERGLRIERRLQLAAGQTREVLWPMVVPEGAGALRWRITAEGGPERDALEVTQRVVPALSTTVRQSTLLQLAGSVDLPVAPPRNAVPLTGGVRVGLQASLVEAALAESRRWITRYPYTGLEQQSSRCVSLDDQACWNQLMRELPKYIDGQGLLRHFPESMLAGSEMLTVHLLDLAHAKGWLVPEAPRRRMLDALEALQQGRRAMQDWAPSNALEPIQLAAQATLAEYGVTGLSVRPASLADLSTQSLVDWSRALMATPADAVRDNALQQAGAQLRSRFDVQGTRLRWRDEAAERRWWFMWSGDSTAARLALLAQQWAAIDGAWKADAPLITQGLVGRQNEGRWSTTVGNVWSTVALRRFQQQAEAGPVDGMTHATLGRTTRDAPWTAAKAPDMQFPWPALGARGTLQLRHDGTGQPWATVSVLAAARNAQPVAHGLVVRRTVRPVEQKRPGQWSVGDVYRVKLDLESTAPQTWVVVRDAVPSGATHLGRSLSRESKLARHGEVQAGWLQPSYVERSTESYRAYFHYVPRGRWSVEYSVRLNNAGDLKLPPARVEAMYAPEVFGEGTAQRMKVRP